MGYKTVDLVYGWQSEGENPPVHILSGGLETCCDLAVMASWYVAAVPPGLGHLCTSCALVAAEKGLDLTSYWAARFAAEDAEMKRMGWGLVNYIREQRQRAANNPLPY